MEKVDVDELDSRMGPGSVRASLTKPLGLTNMGANHYELAPGERLAFGVHAHENQEEVFLVQAGTVTFESYPDRAAAEAGVDGERVEATAGDVVRVDVGEYQCGRNEGDERAVVFGVGAPRDGGDLDLLRDCEPCGERTAHRIELADDRESISAVCERCGSETARYT
ncbi:cupin domain-containing protein [Halorubellus sp. JP-L1]|uniref:cupin domain-containing protein n=1 Tax=Halorubellus sp. JP-L1 TaxID=2715753 RepID=UPI00140A2BB2|nr:cupin domain-containing protein [Halorubellus sp. JP-L1]NHN43501.1 cupin domain-containing protein [Halorubellus sp. JP-L1]